MRRAIKKIEEARRTESKLRTQGKQQLMVADESGKHWAITDIPLDVSRPGVSTMWNRNRCLIVYHWPERETITFAELCDFEQNHRGD